MSIQYNFIEKMINIQGLKINFVDKIGEIIHVNGEIENSIGVCPKCGNTTNKEHDYRTQKYQHLDMCGQNVILYIEVKRYVCECDKEHPFSEIVPFARRYQRQTIAYEEYIYELCHKNTIKNVSEVTGLGEEPVQSIYNYYANKAIEESKKETGRENIYLGMDDIAKKKGHNYNTVLYDQDRKELIEIIDGRTIEEVRTAIYKIFSEEERKKVKAVSIDMSSTYAGVVKECFPNAKIVIDRFHISQQLQKQIDEARKHIQNKARKETGDKYIALGIKWSLLKKFEDLTNEEMNKLLDVCEEYPGIGDCLYLKEEFSKFFKIEVKESANAFMDYYIGLVNDYEIPELKEFGKTLNHWREGILNYYDYGISNGFVEGMNNKIKTIKRRAYNYRNANNYRTRLLEECSKCA